MCVRALGRRFEVATCWKVSKNGTKSRGEKSKTVLPTTMKPKAMTNRRSITICNYEKRRDVWRRRLFERQQLLDGHPAELVEVLVEVGAPVAPGAAPHLGREVGRRDAVEDARDGPPRERLVAVVEDQRADVRTHLFQPVLRSKLAVDLEGDWIGSIYEEFHCWSLKIKIDEGPAGKFFAILVLNEKKTHHSFY